MEINHKWKWSWVRSNSFLNSQKKNIYFDFCETLASFQTADAFVDFVRNSSNKSLFRTTLETFYIVFKRIKLFSFLERILPERSIEKKFKLYQIKGMHFDELNRIAKQYYIDVIRNNWIVDVFDDFLRNYNSLENITIISGGYDIYLNHFIAEFPKCNLICTKLEFERSFFTGKLNGKDCLFQQKVVLLNQLNFPKENSFIYTDSHTDLPLLLWGENGIVVSKNKHQHWVNIDQFTEIIWNS